MSCDCINYDNFPVIVYFAIEPKKAKLDQSQPVAIDFGV
jgi:hypothetical protein